MKQWAKAKRMDLSMAYTIHNYNNKIHGKCKLNAKNGRNMRESHPKRLEYQLKNGNEEQVVVEVV